MFKTLKKIKEEAFPENSPVVPLTFDKRMRLRHIGRGILLTKDVQKYEASLPDEAANATFVDYQNIISRDVGADSGEDSSSN